MPLDPQALGRALDEKLTLHSTLCRREAAAFQQAIRTGEQVVVACTQEKRLFGELGRQTEGAVSPVRFVNIRETGGWSRDAKAAGPKIAALLAAARLPEPEPVPTVGYDSSAARLLVIGPLEEAERFAVLAGDGFQATLLSTGGSGSQERRWPVLAGRIDSLRGWLGAFELAWTQDNPIDLDLCTRCNACIAACPEDAIGLDYQIDLQACKSHRDCVKVCEAAGAIDFDARAAGAHRQLRPGAGPARAARLPAARAAAGLLPPAAGEGGRRRGPGRRAATARAGGRVRQAAVRRLQAEALRPQPQRAGSAATPAWTSVRPRRSPATRRASR